MTQSELFEPAPFLPVSDLQQLKAFTDPLRTRILHLLADREMTNQQLASALDESQAKVLYHVRFLLDVGLIVLVDQRVKGGNVEKYYRASARIYGFRPDPGTEGDLPRSVSTAGLQAVMQEFSASLALWPEQELYWEGRRARLSPERVEEFHIRLNELLEEFWGGLTERIYEESDNPIISFASTVYRFPGGEE
ncbi:MAG TPA: winged helix-turn-helix domain-containing protein [Thermomicrobiales bacterium]|nr:winged helix-turn-helix domain-containing protein [Thermomicrobiales bacterium]